MIENQFRELLEYNKRYWYSYQSPLTCLLGSDGVGHDYIHPMDQFQAACRNALTMYDAVVSMREDLELAQIDLEEATHAENRLSGAAMKRNDVAKRRAARKVEALKHQISEREEAFKVFYTHAMELLPIISKYKHFDEALPEIWAARVAYNAQCANHPLGREFKVALMTEEQKKHLHDALQFPDEMKLIAPDSRAVLRAVSDLATKMKELPATNPGIEYEGAD